MSVRKERLIEFGGIFSTYENVLIRSSRSSLNFKFQLYVVRGELVFRNLRRQSKGGHETSDTIRTSQDLQGKALPVNAACVMIPEKASMARRPFFSSLILYLARFAGFAPNLSGSNEKSPFQTYLKIKVHTQRRPGCFHVHIPG